LRAAFHRAPELQPPAEFADRLRNRLRDTAVAYGRSSTFPWEWFALAAGLVLAAGLAAGVSLNRSATPDEVLARDAVGDHRNCALTVRLVRRSVPLEEAARRFDGAYRLLLSAPPDDISTPAGTARVIERHSCTYGARRFGHVVMQYRGRAVSLLMTANGSGTGAAEPTDAMPHLIGRQVDELSVVSVNGSHYAILLVGDLGSRELTELSRSVSMPLAERLGSLLPARRTQAAWLTAEPVPALSLPLRRCCQ